MILVLVTSAHSPNRLIRSVVQEIQASGETCLISTVPSLFLLYDNSGRAQILHHQQGMIEPNVIFHWVGGRQAYSTLDALELGGYRLINPLNAWRIGRNKAMQLALFEREGIAHPWTLFAQDVSWARITDHLEWDGQEYVFKPHNAGRGRDVQKTRQERMAADMYSRTPRYREGVLIQEYLDHAPKPRHHFRVNVIGGEPVTGTEIRATGGNWLTNQAQGGNILSPDYGVEDIPGDAIRLALRATRAIGADYSGVDVIEGSDGAFYVLETNEFPGFGERTGPYLGKHIVEVARQESARSTS